MKKRLKAKVCLMALLYSYLSVVNIYAINQQEHQKNKHIGLQDSSAVKVQLLFNQKIPMRDGISLSANIFKPENQQLPLPVILVLTPYIADHNQARGMFFAKNKYVFVAVDQRGRGNSDGKFIPFENDGQDGYDVIQWIAKQAWCNGKVGMMGGSYTGMNQWLTLKELPPNLKSIAPVSAVAPGIDFPKTKNIFYPYMAQWLAYTSARTPNTKLFQSDIWETGYQKIYQEHIPYKDVATTLMIEPSVFQKWISHPAQDAYWKGILPDSNTYKNTNIPILSITGHFDVDQLGAFHYYKAHQKYGSEEAKAQHYLLIGPWDHSGTRRPKAELGGLKFGQNAVWDMLQLHLEWFDFTLKAKSKPKQLKDNVGIYVISDNEWKYKSNLTSLVADTISFHLASLNSNAEDVFASGQLLPQLITDDIPDKLHYNPLENINNKFNKMPNGKEWILDKKYLSKKGVLYFHTKALKEDLTITGEINTTLFLQLDAPDTDLFVEVYEITGAGESIFLSSDYLRAKYRNSLSKAELIKADDINAYSFEGTFNAKKIAKGSRLRLVFGYVDSPYFQRNYNSGKDALNETKADAQSINIQLYHNSTYPSKISIPIMSANKQDGMGVLN